MNRLKSIKTLSVLIVLEGVLGIIVVSLLFFSRIENDNLKEEVLKYQKQYNIKPYISISRLQIDSVSPNATVFATEIHAGESGSSGDYSEKIVFDSCYESGLWAKNKYMIPDKNNDRDDVFTLSVTANGKSYKEIIVPSW